MPCPHNIEQGWDDTASWQTAEAFNAASILLLFGLAQPNRASGHHRKLILCGFTRTDCIWCTKCTYQFNASAPINADPLSNLIAIDTFPGDGPNEPTCKWIGLVNAKVMLYCLLAIKQQQLRQTKTQSWTRIQVCAKTGASNWRTVVVTAYYKLKGAL